MREIHTIILHHTASPATTTVDTIRRWHTQGNGWSDIGYHYVVRLGDDGHWTVEKGRPESRTGAHDGGENRGSLGIVVCGDYTDQPLPEYAEIALCALVAAKCIEYGVPVERVEGHGEYEPDDTPTRCPGYDMDRVRARVADHLAAWNG